MVELSHFLSTERKIILYCHLHVLNDKHKYTARHQSRKVVLAIGVCVGVWLLCSVSKKILMNYCTVFNETLRK